MQRIDPRRPVIVGAGQHTQRTNVGAEVLEPVVLFAHAIRAALDDAGGSAPGHVGSVRLVRSLSALGYANAPLLAAQLAGVGADDYVVVDGGGETPGAALARACDDIACGNRDSVVLVSGEAWFSRTRAQRSGGELACATQAVDTPPPVHHGSMIEFVHLAERALGIVRPIQEYPLFEQALRVELGHTIAQHQAHLGRFCSRLSAAAVTNPYAWDTMSHGEEEIATPSRINRTVGFPYTKLMVSNEQVDMAAALVVMSTAHADALGIMADRRIYPLAAASGVAPPISERYELYDSVLVREVGRAIDELSNRKCRDAAHVDLYSCFPSAVQIQARELGLDVNGALSLTGGMRFGGGPWCGYATHGFAAMVHALRNDPGSIGLVSANGGAITKLVVTLLSSEPSAAFTYASAQPAIDASPRRAVLEGYSGSAIVESYTVMHGAGGQIENAIMAALTPSGARAWAVVSDIDAAAAMTTDDAMGLSVTLRDGVAAF